MDKLNFLKKLGVDDVAHLYGPLEEHLKGTQALLKRWGSSELLQVAGLFHSVYGTDEFSECLATLQQRPEVASIIGHAEEALVYLYCSCDRGVVFAQFGQGRPVEFKDRFSGRVFTLDKPNAELFCELTVANELELVYISDAFKNQHGAKFFDLFSRMDEYLSANARHAYTTALSEFA